MKHLPVKAWPNGAAVAVMTTVLYECWPDGAVPNHSPMALASPMRPGTPDLQGVCWADYGGETGVWRLLELLERHGVKATVCANARAVERFPESVRAAHAAGHEVAAHSYTQEDLMPYFAPSEEEALIRRCTTIVADAVGQRPTGWISPRATATSHTAELLAAQGYAWHGDYNDTDMPYLVPTRRGDLVALAHSDFTDIRAIRGTPRDFLDVHRDTFDFLLETGGPQIVNLSLHAHFGGRPLMSAMFSQILAHYRQSGAVWFARHDELADWVIRQAADPADTVSQRHPSRDRATAVP